MPKTEPRFEIGQRIEGPRPFDRGVIVARRWDAQDGWRYCIEWPWHWPGKPARSDYAEQDIVPLSAVERLASMANGGEKPAPRPLADDEPWQAVPSAIPL